MRLAEHPPGFCSVCFGAKPDLRFVDCEADYDGAPVLDRETQTIAVLPWSGLLGGHDSLYVCETCVREAGELIEFKPELHDRQFRRLREAELRAEHWERYAKRLEETLQDRPGPTPPRVGRPRKAVA